MDDGAGNHGRRRARRNLTVAGTRVTRRDGRRVTREMEDQCFSSTFFGFGGDGTFAYWNAGVAFSASFVAPGR